MKKIILSLAIILVGLNTFASTPAPVLLSDFIVNADGFAEIGSKKLPKAVLKAVEESYPGVTISKSYVNSAKQYKLDLTMMDQSVTVYTDANGDWMTN